MSTQNINSHDESKIDEEYGSIFTHFGSAIYFGQCFERVVVEYLINKCGESKEFSNLQDIEEQYNKYFDKTLGQLKAVVRDRNFLAPDELNFVNRLVDLRNNLAHSYFRENIHLVATNEGRKIMLKCLSSAQQDFISGMIFFDRKIFDVVSAKTNDDPYLIKCKLNIEQHEFLLNHLKTTA